MKIVSDLFWKSEQGLRYVENEEKFKNEIYFPAFVLSRCSKGSFGQYLDKESGKFSNEKIAKASEKVYKEEKNWLINKLTELFEKRCDPTTNEVCDKRIAKQYYKKEVYPDPFEIYQCIENATFSFQRFKEGKSCKLKPISEMKDGGLTYFSLPHLRATYYDFFGMKSYLTKYMIQYDTQFFERYYGTDVDNHLYLPETFVKTLITKVFPAMIQAHLGKCIEINTTLSQQGGGDEGEIEENRCPDKEYPYYCGSTSYDKEICVQKPEHCNPGTRKLSNASPRYKKARTLEEILEEINTFNIDDFKRNDVMDNVIGDVMDDEDEKKMERGRERDREREKEREKERDLERDRERERQKKVSRAASSAIEKKRVQQKYIHENVGQLLNKIMDASTGIVDYTIDEASGKVIGKIGDVVVGTATFLGSKLANFGSKLKILFFPPKMNPIFLKSEYEKFNEYIEEITMCCLTVKKSTKQEQKAAVEKITALNDMLVKGESVTILEEAIKGDIERKKKFQNTAQKIAEAMKEMGDAEIGDRFRLKAKQTGLSSMAARAEVPSITRDVIVKNAAKTIAESLQKMLQEITGDFGPTQSYEDYEEYQERMSAPKTKQGFVADEDPFWQRNIHETRSRILEQQQNEERIIQEMLEELPSDD